MAGGALIRKRVLSIDTDWYQLKSQKSRLGNQINAIQADRTPNFYFMQYEWGW